MLSETSDLNAPPLSGHHGVKNSSLMQLSSRGLCQRRLKSLLRPLQHLHQVALLSATSWIGSNCVATLRSSFGSMRSTICILLLPMCRLVDASTVCMFRAMVVGIMAAYPGQKAALQPP